MHNIQIFPYFLDYFAQILQIFQNFEASAPSPALAPMLMTKVPDFKLNLSFATHLNENEFLQDWKY